MIIYKIFNICIIIKGGGWMYNTLDIVIKN